MHCTLEPVRALQVVPPVEEGEQQKGAPEEQEIYAKK